MKKVLIIFGGNSFEHYISCLSAKTILNNIDRKKYNVTAVGITKNNEWYIFKDNYNILEKDWTKGKITKIDNIINYLKTFDKVFPIIHGNPVENGNIQGMLNLFNIPYIGTDVLGSITSYDKEITKIICNHHNIPQVPYITITKNKEVNSIPLDYPVIIKPAKCGSSIGINIASNIKEVNKYIKEAFKYDEKVIIEKFIKARELECAIIFDKINKVSSVGEIKSINTFYDYNAKYISNSKLLIPAPISKYLTKEIQELSLKIFTILNLKDLARIDFLYDYINNKLYFNEVNTMPGFTNTSMYPMLLNNKGINIKEIISILIDN
ncbi:MAG: D-alanine--D-alanine ligase [Bacilli bacterium]|nr:D-alanine--D-alanine ligase [Bacilli bacterium]